MLVHTWKVFWDLQCPYSRKNWQRLPKIRERFEPEYDFSIHLTSLVFHRQAFPGQCAAKLIEQKKGPEARLTFIDACYKDQPVFMKGAVGDSRPSEIDAIFAGIAKDAGLFDNIFTEGVFLSMVNDWDTVVKPAWEEHKEALAYGVFGAPKHVIDEVLVPNTESDWGVEEWEKIMTELEGTEDLVGSC